MNTSTKLLRFYVGLIGLWATQIYGQELTARNGGTVQMEKNEVVINLPEIAGHWPSVVGLGNKETPSTAKIATIEFEIRGSAPMLASVVVSEFNYPYTYHSEVRAIEIDSTWRKQRIIIQLNDAVTVPLNLPLFLFDSPVSKAEVRIRGWKVSFDGKSAAN